MLLLYFQNFQRGYSLKPFCATIFAMKMSFEFEFESFMQGKNQIIY